MAAKNLASEDCGNWHTIKTVTEDFPELHGVSSFALVIETVYTIYIGAFMVPSQQKEVVGELDLEAEQQRKSLDALLAAVHVVSQEQVVLLRGVAADLEHAEQVRVLSMGVAHHVDRRRHLEQHGLP